MLVSRLLAYELASRLWSRIPLAGLVSIVFILLGLLTLVVPEAAPEKVSILMG